jgi:hypothetical protein
MSDTDPPTAPSLAMLQSLALRGIEETKATRREVGDMRSLLLALTDQVRRNERRMAEVRDDIEVMLKAELMGRLGNFETRMETILDRLGERVSDMEAAKDA